MTISSKAPANKSSFSAKKLLEFFWIFRRRISRRILLLEFMPSALLLIEASLSGAQVDLGHCRFIELPDGAVDRGTPVDSSAMADLISATCKEEKLPSLRVAVVLPPEAIHISSHWLPSGLELNELRKFVLEPGSPVQLPFPLDQTDFELVPHQTPVIEGSKDLKYYCLLAVSKRLTNRLIDTFNITEQELLYVGSNMMGLLRLARYSLLSLAKHEVILLVELLADYSHVTIASATAPICCERITAIREFPAIIIPDQNSEASDIRSGLPDDYLPLSDLDVRAISVDINAFIREFEQKSIVPLQVAQVFLSGPSSAHPGLDELLAESLNLPVQCLRVRNDPQLSSLQLPEGINASALSRLFGLVLNFMPAPICTEDWNTIKRPVGKEDTIIEEQIQVEPVLFLSDEVEPDLAQASVDLQPELGIEPVFSFPDEGVEISNELRLDSDLEEEVIIEPDEPFSLGLGDPGQDDPSDWPSINN
jgi:hypothetical protein